MQLVLSLTMPVPEICYAFASILVADPAAAVLRASAQRPSPSFGIMAV